MTQERIAPFVRRVILFVRRVLGWHTRDMVNMMPLCGCIHTVVTVHTRAVF